MNLSDVVRDLETKREHLSIAIDVLKAYGHSVEAAPPAQAQIEAPAEERPRRGRKPGRKPAKVAKVRGRRKAGGACEKHPDATEFDKKGKCRQCQRDYQKEYQRKKKLAAKGAAASPSPARPRRPAAAPPMDHEDADLDDTDIDDDDVEEAPAPAAPRQFMWSKPTQCPKCREMTRLRRLANADMAKDAWIHPGPNCIVKIAHYKIKDDPKFVGDAATPPRSA